MLNQPVAPDFQPEDKFVLPETGISLDDIEKDLIVQALDKANNNKTLAAKLLNLSYDSLRYQIKKFKLDKE
jgi:transcriptional regulator with PAS, ATPase and Fis domain